jgi:hypothetical protein
MYEEGNTTSSAQDLIQKVVDKHGLQAVFRLMAKPRVHNPSTRQTDAQTLSATSVDLNQPHAVPSFGVHLPFVMSLQGVSLAGPKASSQSPNSEHKLSTATTPIVLSTSDLQERTLPDHRSGRDSREEIARLLEHMQPIIVKKERPANGFKPAPPQETDPERPASPALSSTTTTSHSSQSPEEPLVKGAGTGSPPPLFDSATATAAATEQPIHTLAHDTVDLAAVEALLTLSTRITSTAAAGKRSRTGGYDDELLAPPDDETAQAGAARLAATGEMLPAGNGKWDSLCHRPEKTGRKRRRRVHPGADALEGGARMAPAGKGPRQMQHVLSSGATSSFSSSPPAPALVPSAAQHAAVLAGCNACVSRGTEKKINAERTVTSQGRRSRGVAGGVAMRDSSTSGEIDMASASAPSSLHNAAVQLLLSAAATAAVKGEHDGDGNGDADADADADAGFTGGRGSYKCGRCGQPKKGHKCVLYERGYLLESAGKGAAMVALDQQPLPAASYPGASRIVGAGMQGNRHALEASCAAPRMQAQSAAASQGQVAGPTSVESGDMNSRGEGSTEEGDASEGGFGVGGGGPDRAGSRKAGSPGARGGASRAGRCGGVGGMWRGGRPGEDVAPPDSACNPSASQVAGSAALVALAARGRSSPLASPVTPPCSNMLGGDMVEEVSRARGKGSLVAATVGGQESGSEPAPKSAKVARCMILSKRPSKTASRAAALKTKDKSPGSDSRRLGRADEGPPGQAAAFYCASGPLPSKAAGAASGGQSPAPAGNTLAAIRHKAPQAAAAVSNQMALFLAGCSSARSRRDDARLARVVQHEGVEGEEQSGEG